MVSLELTTRCTLRALFGSPVSKASKDKTESQDNQGNTKSVLRVMLWRSVISKASDSGDAMILRKPTAFRYGVGECGTGPHADILEFMLFGDI